jgi:hypothetical protein
MPVENKNDETSSEEIEVVLEEPQQAEAESGGAVEADPVEEQAAPPSSDEEELGQYSDKVQKRIAKLTGKLREAERREQAAIEYAKALKVQQEQSATQVTQLANGHLYEYGERLKAQEMILNQALKSAIDRGDTDKQIEAQKAMADLALEKRRYQSMEQQRQNAAQQRQETPAQPPPQQVAPAPPPDPRAEQWAQRNEWFGKDEAMTLTAFSIHKKLVETEGFDPTSDDYYREIDSRIRREFPHKFQRPPPTTVAPAVRTMQQGSKQTTQVRLTPSQVAIAKKLGVSLEQYARQVAKLNNS